MEVFRSLSFLRSQRQGIFIRETTKVRKVSGKRQRVSGGKKTKRTNPSRVTTKARGKEKSKKVTSFSDVPAEYTFESWWREQNDADWVVVAEKIKNGEDYFGTSWLLPNNSTSIARISRKVDFDGHIGDGLPDFGRSEGQTVYLPHGSLPGEPEAFVVWRDFHNLYPQELTVIQEFVFYHGLYFDKATGSYIEPISQTPVVLHESEGLKLRVSRDHLQDFLAARNAVLVRGFDNRFLRMVEVVPAIEVEIRNPNAFFRLIVRAYDDQSLGTNLFCWLLGKYFVYPFSEPKHKSYRRLLKRHTEEPPKIPFIVGKDRSGQPVTASSHQDADFLTPVFFKKSLLEKYHNNPRLYRVDERTIWYLSEWSIPYGLNQAGLVHVWLGDLWRDLPYEEQQYWRSFNVNPSGGLEPAFWATQMEAEFAESERIDQRVLRARKALEEAFSSRFSFPLFRPIPKEEQFILSNLHVPHSPELREFNEQISYLAKLFVEPLDKDAIEAGVTAKQDLVDDKGNKKASIQVLEIFFRDTEVAQGQAFCDQLRGLQSIRSTMPAHLTSTSDRGKLFTKLGLNDARGFQENFYKLLERMFQTITALSEELGL
jgi:hypothetical protein